MLEHNYTVVVSVPYRHALIALVSLSALRYIASQRVCSDCCVAIRFSLVSRISTPCCHNCDRVHSVRLCFSDHDRSPVYSWKTDVANEDDNSGGKVPPSKL
jgi:hypothetical protein